MNRVSCLRTTRFLNLSEYFLDDVRVTFISFGTNRQKVVGIEQIQNAEIFYVISSLSLCQLSQRYSTEAVPLSFVDSPNFGSLDDNQMTKMLHVRQREVRHFYILYMLYNHLNWMTLFDIEL